MYSNHAEIRMQQRAISSSTIEILLDFGDVEFHHGCEIFSLRKSLCKRLVRLKLISKSLLEKATGIYVVMKGEHVITVGHRYRRFKRNRK
jgi:hypothetical protein